MVARESKGEQDSGDCGDALKMIPAEFPQRNAIYGAPTGMDESQVRPLRVYVDRVQGGSCDGALLIVAAYKPDAEELARLNAGGFIFLLPPHFLSTSFEEATHPA